jgi:hypothetical protein
MATITTIRILTSISTIPTPRKSSSRKEKGRRLDGGLFYRPKRVDQITITLVPTFTRS